MNSVRLGLLLLFISVCAPGYAQNAMELNRSGKWAEAAAVALSEVENQKTPLPQKCEAYYSLVYAEIRLNRSEAAREHLGLFDRTCSELDIPWLEAEVSRLRDELRSQPKVAMRQSGDGWVVVSDPASLGLSGDALAAHEKLCGDSGADACVLVYRGKIVQEWYGPRYREPAYAMSATKSVSGLLVGMLVDDEKLSVDDGVSRYIPQWRAGAESGVTVRHLLTMTSGLPRLYDDGVGGVEDKESFVFALPLSYGPGTRWEQSPGSRLQQYLPKTCKKTTGCCGGCTAILEDSQRADVLTPMGSDPNLSHREQHPGSDPNLSHRDRPGGRRS